MAKIIFILGLCGSGKTYYAEQMKKKSQSLVIIDEGLDPHPNFDKKTFDQNYSKLTSNVSKGIDCVVIEIVLCHEEVREMLLQKIKQDIPNVKIEWKCFENNLEKSNKNLENNDRKKIKPNIEGFKNINSMVYKYYTYPKDAEKLTIYSKDN